MDLSRRNCSRPKLGPVEPVLAAKSDPGAVLGEIEEKKVIRGCWILN